MTAPSIAPPATPDQLAAVPGLTAEAPPSAEVPEPAAAGEPPLAAAASPTEFYDSTRPHLIPAGTTHAALYFDGLYGPAGQAAGHDFAEVRWITITGDGRNAGIADYEPRNPVFDEPGRLAEFVDYRISHDHRARVYVQRSLASRVLAELGRLITNPRCLFWIPTLDNRLWTVDELADDLRRNWNAPIPPSQLWANQNVPGGRWDRSQLWGVW